MRAALTAFFKKPYALAAWGFFLYFLLCFVLHPNGGFALYAGADADDLLRLARAQNWLMGQGWYDHHVAQLGLNGDALVPWSRLVDLPLAALALLFAPLMGLHRAFELAGLIGPPVLLAAGLIPLTLALARLGLPRERRWLAVLVLFGLGAPLLTQFAPSRVDHHAYQILIAGFALLALLRAMVWRAAAALAVGLWIGGEAAPVLMLFAATLGADGAWRGGAVLRRGAVFGLALSVFSLLLLPVAREPALWGNFELTWFSSAYVLFALLIGGALFLSWLIGRRLTARSMRCVLAAGLALGAAALFLALVPGAWRGPYANLPQDSAAMILPHVGEAQPLLRLLGERAGINGAFVINLIVALGLLVGPVAGFVQSIQMARRGGRAGRMGFVFALWIGLYLMAALLWQWRVFFFAQLFALVPLSRLVWRLSGRARQGESRAQFWRRAGIFLALTFGPTVFLPLLATNKPIYPDSLLFYARARAHVACDMRRAWDYLAAPKGLGGRSLRLANMINEGAGLVFYTPHRVMAAPYGVPSNGTSLAFFSARDMESARQMAQDWAIDAVVACRRIPPFYSGNGRLPDIAGGAGGRLQMWSDARHPTLAEKLAAGKPPGWLRPAPGFEDADVRLYVREGAP